MELTKSFVVDDAGNVKSVILDYEQFKKVEEILLDYGIAKAMNEVADDDEISLEEAVKLTGSKN
ncbi:MAG: antitoxin [Ignavibacteria bacterium CG22_combo_CG10-13_8_21_14_all_37_15]|nr:antitoxin [Ignavibacteria bacterium]NCQ17708.1 antitoxin [Ignavibacteria bacterium]PIP78130.1 MAG: antitoxin [Ignavibacteria bacterium CG22_combo_CG10-13_8_21_14_all_37_15]